MEYFIDKQGYLYTQQNGQYLNLTNNQYALGGTELYPPSINVLVNNNIVPAWHIGLEIKTVVNNTLQKVNSTHTSIHGGNVYQISNGNGVTYVAIDPSGNMVNVPQNEVRTKGTGVQMGAVQSNVTPMYGNNNYMANQQQTGGVPNTITSGANNVTATSSTSGVSEISVSNTVTTTTPVNVNTVQPQVNNTIEKPRHVGQFPSIEPLVITKKREEVKIDGNEYVYGYYKDYALNKLRLENMEFVKDIKLLSGIQYKHLYTLLHTDDKETREHVDVINIISLNEGYCLKNNLDVAKAMFSLTTWDEVHNEILSLEDKSLKRYLNTIITDLLNDRLRFLGIKFYPNSGGYNVNMMDSFIDVKKGYHSFMSKIKPMTDSNNDKYNEAVASRLNKVMVDAKSSLVDAMESVGEIDMVVTEDMEEMLKSVNCTPLALPEYIKGIMLYGKAICEEMDAIEIGGSRNITPSEKLTRILEMVKENTDGKPLDYYKVRMFTAKGEYALTTYHNEFVISRLN